MNKVTIKDINILSNLRGSYYIFEENIKSFPYQSVKSLFSIHSSLRLVSILGYNDSRLDDYPPKGYFHKHSVGSSTKCETSHDFQVHLIQLTALEYITASH